MGGNKVHRYFLEDDFAPDLVYTDTYPKIILWTTDKSITIDAFDFHARVVDRQNAPNEDRRFIPQVQVSIMRGDNSHSNDPRNDKELSPAQSLEEAVFTINAYITRQADKL